MVPLSITTGGPCGKFGHVQSPAVGPIHDPHRRRFVRLNEQRLVPLDAERASLVDRDFRPAGRLCVASNRVPEVNVAGSRSMLPV